VSAGLPVVSGQRLVRVVERGGWEVVRQRGSLGQMEAEGAALFHFRGGRVTRIDHYFDRGRALADLGLAE
jgi:predicted RNA binding protein YcfA (HicA-like mRNA interferase family)